MKDTHVCIITLNNTDEKRAVDQDFHLNLHLIQLQHFYRDTFERKLINAVHLSDVSKNLHH